MPYLGMLLPGLAMWLISNADLPVFDEWIAQCRVTHWRARDPDGHDRFIIRDKQARTVAELNLYSLAVQSVQDLTGNGYPEVIMRAVQHPSAHGGVRFFVFSLGSKPNCLMDYDKNNVWGDEVDFLPCDLDGDGVKEIISWYDGFAYAFGSSYGGSPRVPVVLRYANGRYVEDTSRYTTFLRLRLAEGEQSLRSCDGDNWNPFSNAVHYYSILRLTHSQAESKRRLWRLIDDVPRLSTAVEKLRDRDFPHVLDRAGFQKELALIERVLSEKSQRYAWPKTYTRETIISYVCE